MNLRRRPTVDAVDETGARRKVKVRDVYRVVLEVFAKKRMVAWYTPVVIRDSAENFSRLGAPAFHS